jgi:hypothetical protein
MAESRMIPAHPVSPPRRSGARPPLRPTRPVRPNPSPRLPLEETQSLGPLPEWQETPTLPAREAPARPGRVEAAEPAPDRPGVEMKSPRSQAEKALFLVLLLSLGLNLAAFLSARERLTRADFLFAAVILVSGVALLVFTEISRRSGRSRSSD